MVVKPRVNFENQEMGRAAKHAFTFGSGPVIESEDEQRGLILSANRKEFMSGFCTHVYSKSNNKSTDRPQNIAFSNYATRELIKSGGNISTSSNIIPSVYSSNELIKSAYPKWRHASEEVKMHYHQKALRKLADKLGHQPYAFTMLLSPEIGKQIIKQGGSGYLHERLVLKLKRALNRSVIMWLVLEAVKTKSNHNIMIHGKGPVDRFDGLLHVHGAITLKSDEIPILDRIVRSLNSSNNPKFNNQELRKKVINDDVVWVEYCNKHGFLNQMLLNGLSKYSRSKFLVGTAEKLYQSDRQCIEIYINSDN